VLGHESGNIRFSETRKDRGKVTMEGGPIGTDQRSFERYHRRPPTVRPPLSQDWGVRNPHPKLQSLLSREG